MVHTSIQFKAGLEMQIAVILDSSPATTKDYSAPSMAMHNQPSTSFRAIMLLIHRWPWAGTSARVKWKFLKWFIARPANKTHCRLNASPKFWMIELAWIPAWKWYGSHMQKYVTVGVTPCSSTFFTSSRPWSGIGRKKSYNLAFDITRKLRPFNIAQTHCMNRVHLPIAFFSQTLIAGAWNLCEYSITEPKHSISFWTKTSNIQRRMRCASCRWCMRKTRNVTVSMPAIATGAKW